MSEVTANEQPLPADPPLRPTSSSSLPFACPLPNCTKSFLKQSRLNRHLQVHSNVRAHICDFPQCQRSFTRKTHLDRHRQVHDTKREKKYVCDMPDCNAAFFLKEHLTRHYKAHMNSYKCDWEGCHEAFDKHRKLREHRLTHTGLLPYKCLEPLGKNNNNGSMNTISSSTGAYDDARSNEETKTITSSLLPSSTIQSSSSSSSSSFSSNPNNDSSSNLTQELCQEAFATRALLAKHKRTVHNPVEHVCADEQCQRTFTRFIDYRNHIRIDHAGKKTCPQCKKLIAKNYWSGHLKIHSPDRKWYVCPYEGCGGEYTTSSNLDAHVRVKHVQQRIACGLCDKTFSYKQNLKKHMQREHPGALDNVDMEDEDVEHPSTPSTPTPESSNEHASHTSASSSTSTIASGFLNITTPIHSSTSNYDPQLEGTVPVCG